MGDKISSNIRLFELEKIVLKEPILIQGLPGIGYVGKIAIDFFIEQLRPHKIAEIYSTYLTLPDGDIGIQVELNGKYSLPKYEFYAYHTKTPHIIFLTGDIQPRPRGQYKIAETVLDFIEKFGCKTIVALGGYRMSQNKDDVYVVSNNLGLIKHYKNRVQIAQEGVVKGAIGIILGLGTKRGMNCLGLLGATRGIYPDLQSSKNIVQIISEMFNLPINITILDHYIAKMKAKLKTFQKLRIHIPLRERAEKEKVPEGYIS